MPRKPQYTVQLRDPALGWQAVAVTHTREVAIRIMDDWLLALGGKYSMSVHKINGYQVWTVEVAYVGTHDYGDTTKTSRWDGS